MEGSEKAFGTGMGAVGKGTIANERCTWARYTGEGLMTDYFHCRMFLKCAAAGSISTATHVAMQALPEPAVAQTALRHAGAASLKTSLNAYSFSKPLNDAAKMRGPGMSLF